MTSLLVPLLTAAQVARVLGVSSQTVYSLARVGSLRAVVFETCGDRWTYRFREEDIASFVDANLREGRA